MNGRVSQECDNYAFLHSGAYRNIVGTKQRQNAASDINGYLKLRHGNRKIWLKYHAWNGVKADEVQLSYLNRSRLDAVNPDTEVEIKKSNWFAYYWLHGDSGIKWPFRLTFIGVAMTVVSGIISIILTA